MQVTDIVIKGNDLKPGQDKRTYQVWLGEELLLPHSHDPEHDACRALSARGVTGKLRTRWDGADHHSLVMGIEWGAARKTEDSRVRTATVKFVPFGKKDMSSYELRPSQGLAKTA